MVPPKKSKKSESLTFKIKTTFKSGVSKGIVASVGGIVGLMGKYGWISSILSDPFLGFVSGTWGGAVASDIIALIFGKHIKAGWDVGVLKGIIAAAGGLLGHQFLHINGIFLDYTVGVIVSMFLTDVLISHR